MFELIAFDADDTLWHNERLYRMGQARFRELLAPYGVLEALDGRLEEIEHRNLTYYGYGVVGFAFSLIETAIELTAGRVSGRDIQAMVDLSKEMLMAEVELFDHAASTVAGLSQVYPLMLITKGDLRHQQSKLARSGLSDYFRYVEIVCDKTVDVYASILRKYHIDPGRFLMVGNSLRSDVLPVLQLGGWAIYIPHELTWSHEIVTPPAELGPRYFQLEHLGHLPALLERIAQPAPRGGFYDRPE